MSTRRSTRAASSRAASPAPTNASTTSRRPARRAGNAQLPALNLRASTAYGTNTTPLMTGRSGQVNQQLGAVLQNILPQNNDEAGTNRPPRGLRRGRAGNDFVDPDRTYGAENEIFGLTNFDTSSISHHSDAHGNNDNNDHDEPETMPQQPQPADSHPPGGSKPPGSKPPGSKPPGSKPPGTNGQQNGGNYNYWGNQGFGRPLGTTWGWPAWIHQTVDVFKQLSYFIARQFLRIWRLIFNRYGAIILLILLLSIFSDFRKPTGPIDDEVGDRPDKPTGGYTIGLPEFSIPHWVKHPMDTIFERLGPGVVQDLGNRIKNQELTLDRVWKQVKLNTAAIKKLNEGLPDQIFVKKDKDGNLQIPHEIWEPLREIIRSDPELQDMINNSQGSDPSNKPNTQQLSAKEMSKFFEKFLDANRARIATLANDDLTKKFPNLLKDNIIVTKPQIIEMIQKDWDDNKKARQTEIAKLQEQLDQQQRQITKLGREHTVGRSEKQLKALIEKVVREVGGAGASHGGGANWGQTRINHWSHGTGAVVDPYATSPNYQFPSMKQWLPAKTFRYVIGNPVPIPNPPEAALRKWDEHGDCWCSPAGGSDGHGASIAVISGSSIYPEQIVVEHIAPTASLEPGAAPKEMELWAYVHDMDTYDEMKKISTEIFGTNFAVQTQQTMGYVRIATWTYNLESSDNIQAFPVQLDMKDLSTHTNKLIVRAKNNWGDGKVDYTCLYRVRIHGEIHINQQEA